MEQKPDKANRVSTGDQKAFAPSTPVDVRQDSDFAHVLFFDIVGYSLLKTDVGGELVEDVFRIISATPEFKRARQSNSLLLLPSGDGAAIVFLRDPAAPVRCALEISQAIQARPDIQIRMGINTGACTWITDFNDHEVLTGAGINYAQRAMDCGDSGHILLTESIAKYLLEFSVWAECIEDIGEYETKHGKTIHLYNLRRGALGNSAPLTRAVLITPPKSQRVTSQVARSPGFRFSLSLRWLPRSSWSFWTGGIALVALTATGLYYSLGFFEPKEHIVPILVKLKGPDPVGFPALSPDGTRIVYSRRVGRRWNVYLTHFTGRELTGEPVNISGGLAGDNNEPAFSPGGDEIAFVNETGPIPNENGLITGAFTPGSAIWVYSLKSGRLERIADRGYNPSWSPDGTTIAVATEGVTAPEDRSTLDSKIILVKVATKVQSEIPNLVGDAVQPSWSPTGKRLAFWFINQEGKRDIATVNVEDGKDRRPVTSDGAMNWDPSWGKDGYVYFCSKRGGTRSNLWRVRVDESSGRLGGKPKQVEVEGSPTRADGALSGIAQISLNANLGVMFIKRDLFSSIHGLNIDSLHAGTQPGWTIQGDPGTVLSRPDLSPDGDLIVYNGSNGPVDSVTVNDPSGVLGYEVTHSDGLASEPVWLRWLNDKGSSPSMDRGPRWSPDGGKIAFFSNRNGREWEVWGVDRDGADASQLTKCEGQDCFGNFYPVWAPQGNRIAYTRRGSKTSDMQTLISSLSSGLEAGVAIPRFENPDEGFTAWSWSPNGLALAGYTLRSDGSLGGIYSCNSGDGTFIDAKYRRLSTFGMDPIWLKDSQHLLFLNKGNIYILDASVQDPSSTIRVFYAPKNFDVAKRGFAVTRDNSAIVFASEMSSTRLYIGNAKH